MFAAINLLPLDEIQCLLQSTPLNPWTPGSLDPWTPAPLAPAPLDPGPWTPGHLDPGLLDPWTLPALACLCDRHPDTERKKGRRMGEGP